jgi:hypothetical protein
MKTTSKKKKPGRKPIPENEKSIKRSTSFPPKMWDWIIKRAGTTGVPSRVIQEAVRVLQESTERAETVGEKKKALGLAKIKKSVGKIADDSDGRHFSEA